MVEESWSSVVESDLDNIIDLYWLAAYGAVKAYLPTKDTYYLGSADKLIYLV